MNDSVIHNHSRHLVTCCWIVSGFRQTDRQTDGLTDGQTDRQMDGWLVCSSSMFLISVAGTIITVVWLTIINLNPGFSLWLQLSYSILCRTGSFLTLDWSEHCESTYKRNCCSLPAWRGEWLLFLVFCCCIAIAKHSMLICVCYCLFYLNCKYG